MVNKTDETNKTKPKPKRKSQGWRTHIRRLKQAARKGGGAQGVTDEHRRAT